MGPSGSPLGLAHFCTFLRFSAPCFPLIFLHFAPFVAAFLGHNEPAKMEPKWSQNEMDTRRRREQKRAIQLGGAARERQAARDLRF